MASVQEMKDALAAQQDVAFRATELALTSINSMISLSQLVLGVVALVVAVIAVFGWVVMQRACTRRAENIANKRLDDHLNSAIFEALVSRTMASAIDAKWQTTVILKGLEPAQSTGESQPFPAKPETGADK